MHFHLVCSVSSEKEREKEQVSFIAFVKGVNSRRKLSAVNTVISFTDHAKVWCFEQMLYPKYIIHGDRRSHFDKDFPSAPHIHRFTKLLN